MVNRSSLRHVTLDIKNLSLYFWLLFKILLRHTLNTSQSSFFFGIRLLLTQVIFHLRLFSTLKQIRICFTVSFTFLVSYCLNGVPFRDPKYYGNSFRLPAEICHCLHDKTLEISTSYTFRVTLITIGDRNVAIWRQLAGVNTTRLRKKNKNSKNLVRVA